MGLYNRLLPERNLVSLSRHIKHVRFPEAPQDPAGTPSANPLKIAVVQSDTHFTEEFWAALNVHSALTLHSASEENILSQLEQRVGTWDVIIYPIFAHWQKALDFSRKVRRIRERDGVRLQPPDEKRGKIGVVVQDSRPGEAVMVGFGIPSIAEQFLAEDLELLPAKDFLLVAIDHGLQLARQPGDTPKLRVQKESLEALLNAEIPSRNVEFVAEESKAGEITIAFAIAASQRPETPWINIFMTDQEREAAGIKEALANRPGHPDYDTGQTWIECRIPEDEIREEFFIEQTLIRSGAAKSILMLLGDMHIEAVAEKLKGALHRVSTNHNLCPVRRWE